MMLSCSFVMILQIIHLINAPLGYNTKNIFVVENTAFRTPSKAKVFADKLYNISGVGKVGMCAGVPMFGSNNLSTEFLDGGVKKEISFPGIPNEQRGIRHSRIKDPSG
ncbi:MAG: hypothetical protein L6V92_08685 [Phocaeicola vulgatus]|nr:MAG: hypothetical protein L6V92_08685 [Phocaeicola vulgatus]